MTFGTPPTSTATMSEGLSLLPQLSGKPTVCRYRCDGVSSLGYTGRDLYIVATAAPDPTPTSAVQCSIRVFATIAWRASLITARPDSGWT